MSKGPSAIEVAIRNAGLRQGWTAMSWVLDWGVVRGMGGLDGVGSPKGGGHDTSQRLMVVGDWFSYSPAKSWRRQAAFRKAFPEFASPDDLIDLPPNVELRRFLAQMAAIGSAVDRRREVVEAMPKGIALVTSAAVS